MRSRESLRILVVQQSLQPPGGGNGVAAWMVEALKDRHEVSLLTWVRPELPAVNRFFGTALQPSEFESLTVPGPLRAALSRTPTPVGLLKDMLLFRVARGLASRFDLAISASNEADLGKPGIQYIHYPRFDPERPGAELRWYHHAPLVAYRRAAVRLTGFSFRRMRANLTLVNSDWTGRRVRRLHGIDATTLHPPVPGAFPDVPWEERADGFVCIGRFIPEKRLELVIDILENVRARGHAIHLHLVGTPDAPDYTGEIRRLARARAGWVTLHEDVSREELLSLATRNRYGIHGMREEHFGIAVAELLRAGCPVFVPNGGGAVEIVGRDPRLIWETRDEAVEKIVRVLSDAALARGVREQAAARASSLSAERFVERWRAIVAGFPDGIPVEV